MSCRLWPRRKLSTATWAIQVEPITCSRRHKAGQLSRMMHSLTLLVAHDLTRLKVPKFEADHGAARRLEHVTRRGVDAKWRFVCDVEVQGHVPGQASTCRSSSVVV